MVYLRTYVRSINFHGVHYMKEAILGLVKSHPVCDFSSFSKLLKFLTSDPDVRKAGENLTLKEFQDTILDILSNENPWSVIISR